jgi:three-Cys-motif partner protein
MMQGESRLAIPEIVRMVEHQFGGPWTEIKLDAVCYYLECYTKVLSQRQFDLWYVDVFAGTGDRTNEKLTGGLLECQPVRWVTETLPGSAKCAMNIRPPFKHFIFNESDDEHQKALRAIKEANRSLDIEIIGDDANAAIKEIFSRAVWRRGASGGARAVVFLDPYALQVDWGMLEFLAKTRCVDVWYLFPLHDVTRQLAKRRSGIGPKEKRLDKVLGPAWRELYELPPPTNEMFAQTLFGSIPEFAVEEYRNATKAQIEGWFKTRLETLFPYVSEPLPLFTNIKQQKFSLFLAVANPSKPAVDLAKKFHRHVMKNYGPKASRRMSAH